jgi:hypothetical protein
MTDRVEEEPRPHGAGSGDAVAAGSAHASDTLTKRRQDLEAQQAQAFNDIDAVAERRAGLERELIAINDELAAKRDGLEASIAAAEKRIEETRIADERIALQESLQSYRADPSEAEVDARRLEGLVRNRLQDLEVERTSAQGHLQRIPRTWRAYATRCAGVKFRS